MTGAEIVEVAKSQIGVKESPAGSNRVIYNTWYYGREVSGEYYPWCMAFVQWVYAQAGAPIAYKTASCTALRDWAKSRGYWVTSDYLPGDIVIFCGKTSRDPVHTGIIVRQVGSCLITVEGNTHVTSDDNGGAVMQRERPLTNVLGAVRLIGDVPQQNKPQEGKQVQITLLQLSRGGKGLMVEALQALVNAQIAKRKLQLQPLEIDGSYGSKTEAAVSEVQRAMGIEADGITGPVTWSKLLGGNG